MHALNVVLVVLALTPVLASGLTGSFLHVSDVHYDPLAAPEVYGPVTHCRPPTVPFSARSSWVRSRLSRLAPQRDDTAGTPFGTSGCDTPASLLEVLFENMHANLPQPDFILLSGDLAAHSLPSNVTLQAIQTVMSKFDSYFPGVPVYPAIGNNDASADYTMTCGPSTWLANLSSIWTWIPKSQHEQFMRSGSYAVLLPQQKVKLLVLNTIYYSPNHEPAFLSPDPCGQFEWLANELKDALAQHLTVYIMAHIPPGIDSYAFVPLWNATFDRIYYSLLSEHASIIAGGFFGHLHSDEFRLVNFSLPGAGVSTTSFLLAPSVSPIYGNNPSYRVVSYNTSTFAINNYQQIYANLTQANQLGVMLWIPEYDFDSAYNQVMVTESTLESLYNMLTYNEVVFDSWYARKTALGSQTAPPPLNSSTRSELLCTLISADLDRFKSCMQQTP